MTDDLSQLLVTCSYLSVYRVVPTVCDMIQSPVIMECYCKVG